MNSFASLQPSVRLWHEQRAKATCKLAEELVFFPKDTRFPNSWSRQHFATDGACKRSTRLHENRANGLQLRCSRHWQLLSFSTNSDLTKTAFWLSFVDGTEQGSIWSSLCVQGMIMAEKQCVSLWWNIPNDFNMSWLISRNSQQWRSGSLHCSASLKLEHENLHSFCSWRSWSVWNRHFWGFCKDKAIVVLLR